MKLFIPILALGFLLVSMQSRASTNTAEIRYKFLDAAKTGVLPLREVATLNLYFQSKIKDGVVLDGDETERLKTEKLNLLSVDKIYTDKAFTKAVLVKFNIEPNDPNLFGKVIPDKHKGFIFHGRSGMGIPYAVYFHKFDQATVDSLVRGMQKNMSTPLNVSQLPALHFPIMNKMIDAILPKASAEELPECRQGALEDARTNSKYPGWGCIKGALWGAWHGTFGGTWGIFQGDSWNGLGQQWDDFVHMYNDFYGYAAKEYDGFMYLDPGAKGKIVCDLAVTGVLDVGKGLAAPVTGGISVVTAVADQANLHTKYKAELDEARRKHEQNCPKDSAAKPAEEAHGVER